MVRVSVVVPTCKRPELLSRCLAALLEQDCAPADYEVIIVDDAACSETRLQVERWAKRAALCEQTVRYLAVSDVCRTHGPATARNMGWRAASGEIIAFTDDDCIPDPGWLRIGMAAMMDGISAVAGRVIVPLPEIPTDYEYDASHLEHGEFVTANCFYRREALMMVGGFDERFTAAWREDSDLFFSLLERRIKWARVPEAIVVHPVRPARWGVSLRQQRKSMFNALLYKKHPALYREKIQATPPWRYYVIVLALLVGLIGIVTLWWPLAFVGLLVWASLTSRFCIERLRHTSHAPRHEAEMIVTSIAIPPLAIFWRLRGALRFRVFFL
jgi:cellulose synthase/poly-beta-1,6-N-acetylglucosamine synthase-like glycosyltransferase